MGKFKPGDLVVTKESKGYTRYPREHFPEEIQNEILKRTSIRYCDKGWSTRIPVGEVGVVRGYENLFMYEFRTFNREREKKISVREGRKVIYREMTPEEEAQIIWTQKQRTGTGGSALMYETGYWNVPSKKVLIIAIDGKLIAFDDARGFETATEAGNRYKDVQVTFGFKRSFQNISEKELQTQIRATERKLAKGQKLNFTADDIQPLKATYVMKDGLVREIDFTALEEAEPKAV